MRSHLLGLVLFVAVGGCEGRLDAWPRVRDEYCVALARETPAVVQLRRLMATRLGRLPTDSSVYAAAQACESAEGGLRDVAGRLEGLDRFRLALVETRPTGAHVPVGIGDPLPFLDVRQHANRFAAECQRLTSRPEAVRALEQGLDATLDAVETTLRRRSGRCRQM